MPLERNDVLAIAHLARLEIAEQEIPGYAAQLSAILAFVEQLEAVDTGGITPMAHPLDTTQRLRDDRVTEGDLRDRYQALAPRVENGLYLVPKVID